MRTVIDSITEICSATAASTLVVEIGKKHSRSVAASERRVVEWAESVGLRVVYLGLRDACAEICGTGSFQEAVARILARYPELESRASITGRLYVKDAERWRHVRPLAVAYVLAHAYAARSIVDAFAGEIPPLPPIKPYDPRNP